MRYKTALTKFAGKGVTVEERDSLFTVIRISDASDVSSLTTRANVLSKLYKIYFDNKKSGVFNALKLAVAGTEKENPGISVALASVNENVGYFALSGDMSVWVVRGGNISKILTGPEMKTASGFIKPGDQFILSTNDLSQNFTAEEIEEALKNNKLHDLSRSLPNWGAGVVDTETEESVHVTQPQPAPVFKPQSFNPSVNPARRAMVSVIDRALSVLPKKEIVVRASLVPPAEEEAEGRKRRLTITIGVILLALLLVSIFFGIKKQGEAAFRSRYEGRLTQAEHDFEEAKSLVELNPTRARELVINAKTVAEQIESEGIKDERLTALLGSIKTGLGEIAGIYEGEPNLFLDLSLLSSGFEADQLAYSEGRIVALDRDGKKLVSINAGNKRTEVAAGPDIMPSSISVAAYSDRNFVLATDGVWEVGDKAENLVKKDWDGEVLIAAYSGNLYILDKNASSIWRYPGDGPTFGNKQNWFGPGIKPNLSGAVSWAIDGSIWILNTNGDISKYSLGSPQAFSLSNVDKEFVPASIFVSDETQDLYLLDLENARVVVFSKNGEYKAQYLGEGIKDATQIVISEKDKKIIFLSGTKLYSIEIKHL